MIGKHRTGIALVLSMIGLATMSRFGVDRSWAADMNQCGAAVDFTTVQPDPTQPGFVTVGFHVRTKTRFSVGHFDYSYDANGQSLERTTSGWHAVEGDNFFVSDTFKCVNCVVENVAVLANSINCVAQ